jgi:Protein of unknown function (DUF4240)
MANAPPGRAGAYSFQIEEWIISMSDVFSGVVERYLYRDRSRAYEFFVLRYPPETMERVNRENMTSLDIHRFSNQPKMGPAVVYERDIDTSNPGWDLATYQSGNDGPNESFGGAVKQVAVPVNSTIDDYEFWTLIGVLGGSTARRAVNRLAKHLAKLGEPAVMGFANSLAAKVARLDTPELLDMGRKMPGAMRLSDDTGLYLRFAIVAGGEERFHRAMANPDDAWRAGGGIDGERLGDVASEAFQILSGREVQLVTTINVETGSNRSAWGEPQPKAKSIRAVRTETDLRLQIESELRFTAKLLGVDPADEVWFQYESYSEWFSVRLFAGYEKCVREVVIIFAMPAILRGWVSREDAELAGAAIAHDYAVREGFVLLGETEVFRSTSQYPMNNTYFLWTSSRFRGAAGDYLRKFGQTERLVEERLTDQLQSPSDLGAIEG